jgi:hypothetical protein
MTAMIDPIKAETIIACLTRRVHDAGQSLTIMINAFLKTADDLALSDGDLR